MTEHFKRIGDYISVIDNRNTDGSITKLMGISIDKCYIPSVANVIGTDLSNYKVIHKGQFACSLMQVSRDQRIPIAMYRNVNPAIMSPAYVMFEVTRPDELLPEYMELWFMRSEFDREASFYAVGGVRGSLDWDDFCNMRLPVPPIDEQRKIVHDYQVITDRIELLRKMNENMEEQALTLFKEWFVSYQPFGGDMPDDWKTVTLGDVANMGAGGDRPDVCVDNKSEECMVPIYSNGIEKDGLYGFTDVPRISEESVTVSARGTIGFVCLRTVPYVPIVRLVTLVPKGNIVTAKFLYLYLKNLNIQGTGSTQQQLTVPDFAKTELTLPPYTVISQFTNIVTPFYQAKIQNEYEIDCLGRLAETVLSGVSA